MWLLLGLLFPPLLPVILLCWLLSVSGGSGGGPAPSGLRANRPGAPALPAPVDPNLFRPVTSETDDSFQPARPGGAGVEAPGALCLLCGQPKADGNHSH